MLHSIIPFRAWNFHDFSSVKKLYKIRKIPCIHGNYTRDESMYTCLFLDVYNSTTRGSHMALTYDSFDVTAMFGGSGSLWAHNQSLMADGITPICGPLRGSQLERSSSDKDWLFVWPHQTICYPHASDLHPSPRIGEKGLAGDFNTFTDLNVAVGYLIKKFHRRMTDVNSFEWLLENSQLFPNL